MRIFTIPDIHGRLDLLLKLLHILITEHTLDLTKDKLIFLGDMIDRGPDSKGVLDTIMELKAKYPDNVVVLAGNHEWMAIDAHRKDDYGLEYMWKRNGGLEAMQSFQDPYSPGHILPIPEKYLTWMESLPLSHQEDGFFFSHAPAPIEAKRWAMMKGMPYVKNELIWNRTERGPEINDAAIHPNDVVGVCGHVHALYDGIMAPRFYDHYIFADAGCGCSDEAPLVAIEVKSREAVYAWPDKEVLSEN